MSLILKSLEEDQDWLTNQVNQGSLGGVLQLYDFNHTLLTPNRVIAEAISEVASRALRIKRHHNRDFNYITEMNPIKTFGKAEKICLRKYST